LTSLDGKNLVLFRACSEIGESDYVAISIPKATIDIISGYEGLGGLKNGRYYPYQGPADPPGVLTVGRGHKLTKAEIQNKAFENGLTLAEVDALFKRDLQPRADRLEDLIPQHTTQQFAAALSMFYNYERAWGAKGSPGKYHRAGDKLNTAKSMLLYVYSGSPKKVQKGLWRRRATEALYYLTGKIIISDTANEDTLLVNDLKNAGVITKAP